MAIGRRGYAEAAGALPPAPHRASWWDRLIGRLTPYVQVERTDSRGDPDPFYTPVPDMPTASTPIDATEVLVGARVDVSVWSALKLEYRLTRRDAVDDPDHSLALNWSFGI